MMPKDLIKLPDRVDWKRITPAEKGRVVHEVTSGMQNAVKQIDKGWLYIGMIWHWIIENKLYRHCGDHIHNANDFLREIDLGVKRSMLDHYARMWAMFSKYLPDRNIPIRKLLLVAPVITPDVDVCVWLDKAENLPYDALKNEVREKQGKITTDSCEHPSAYNELWVRCAKCDKWLQKLPKTQGKVQW